jgi:hypothetical protein
MRLEIELLVALKHIITHLMREHEKDKYGFEQSPILFIYNALAYFERQKGLHAFFSLTDVNEIIF